MDTEISFELIKNGEQIDVEYLGNLSDNPAGIVDEMLQQFDLLNEEKRYVREGLKSNPITLKVKKGKDEYEIMAREITKDLDQPICILKVFEYFVF